MTDFVKKIKDFFNSGPSLEEWGKRKVIAEADLGEYVSNNDEVTLYHFSKYINGDSAVLDPGAFLSPKRNTWTRKDYQISGVPRTWFYVEPGQKEIHFKDGTPLFTATVPASDIYDLNKDPDGFKKQAVYPGFGGLNYDKLLKLVKENYKGAYYSQKAFDNVIWFYPLQVKRIEGEEWM